MKEEWHKITPDDGLHWTHFSFSSKILTQEFLQKGHIGNLPPENKKLVWLDTTTGVYPKAKKFIDGKWIITDDGGGGSRNAQGAVYFPKLATGGIINYPNQGVVLGQAIGGESGAVLVNCWDSNCS